MEGKQEGEKQEGENQEGERGGKKLKKRWEKEVGKSGGETKIRWEKIKEKINHVKNETPIYHVNPLPLGGIVIIAGAIDRTT